MAHFCKKSTNVPTVGAEKEEERKCWKWDSCTAV